EDAPEHLDLGLAHRGPDVLHGLLVAVGGQAAVADGGLEGVHDHAVVGHGGARHVQAGNGVAGPGVAGTAVAGTAVAHAKVSSAMAGEQVMPRPPGPVTRTTPGSIGDRWYSSSVVTW